ncbi:MAG: Do family serine endopeptidase [Pseudomonadota bacterium]
MRQPFHARTTLIARMRLAGLLLAGAILAVSPAAARQSITDDVAVNDARATPESFSDLARQLMPAVVNITTRQTIAPNLPDFPEGSPLERFNPFFGRDEEGFRQEGSLGSGFVISADGLVITNDHVIKDADEINAVFADGKTIRAELVGTDPDTDVAVLRLITDDALPFVEFADSDQADVGDWVIAIGNPFGFGGSVSAGIISARNRDTGGRYDDFIQTDAAINRGNSGGPLFNLDGEVVGVNTAIISPTGGSVGIGFSIPSNMVQSISDQLIEFGTLRRGWLGVNVQPADEAIAEAYGVAGREGVVITRVTAGSPAESAGLAVGDLILEIDGAAIPDVRTLTRLVGDAGVDTAVALSVIRNRRERVVEVTLGELDTGGEKDEEAEIPESVLTSNPAGLELVAMDESLRRRYRVPKDIDGVVVGSVSPRGPAFGKINKGDVILEMDFTTVTTPQDAMAAIEASAAAGTGPLLMRVWRTGSSGVSVFVAISLEAGS